MAFAAVGVVAVTAPAATRVETAIVRDARDAVVGGLDLTRVQLGRASDGRLRAALTLGGPWRARDLPAAEGPPGSLCLRLWTRRRAGAAAPPDYLVCVTADRRGRDLRASVLAEEAGELRRVGSATLARSSTRTVVVRFAQSGVGRPASVRFAAEATKPGCPRLDCVDTAPDAPATATLTLRRG
jgi:hypothetical protein